MKTKNILKRILNICLSLLLCVCILYWMYRDFDFSLLNDTIIHKTHWEWMWISLIFGITAQLFRGLRWRQSLSPLGENPRRSSCVYAIFISYASSLVIPRIGEVARCGVLTKYDGTNFTKAIGTVVTERIIDTLLMLVMALFTIFLQIKVFASFFAETGTTFSGLLHSFTTTGYIVSGICVLAIIIMAIVMRKRISALTKINITIKNFKSGILSLKDVENKSLFTFYTLMIWVSYFIHYYLTFFCFDFTKDLGISAALVSFVVGSISVIVPTPNGAGPWHFSVKTILMMYGLGMNDAVIFVLIVHTVQTALIPLLGLVGMIMLKKRKDLQTATATESKDNE